MNDCPAGNETAMDEAEEQTLADALAAGMYDCDHVSRRLGIIIENVAGHHVRIWMRVKKEMLNAHGICHEGVLFTLAGSVFYARI
jgi:acyl-CoA thioesterase